MTPEEQIRHMAEALRLHVFRMKLQRLPLARPECMVGMELGDGLNYMANRQRMIMEAFHETTAQMNYHNLASLGWVREDGVGLN